MNDQHFCVITGTAYVLKVISLHHSLERNAENFTLWICCIDNLAYKVLKKLKLKNTILLTDEQIEDDRLKRIKQERKTNEYCWTLKAPLIEHVLTEYKVESVIYCDGDIYFFSDPSAIFKEWGDDSVYLCPQRDVGWVEQMYGKYQAGLIGFRNDSYGLKSVKWWKEKCYEWCYAKPSEGRFGDQKYLDQIPKYFPKVKISKHLGINAAPWNSIYNNNYNISTRDDHIYIENDKLVAFHFACITIFNKKEFDLWTFDKLSINSVIMSNIYTPYLENIRKSMERVKSLGMKVKPLLSDQEISSAKTLYKYTTLRKKMDQWDDFYHFATIVSQDYLIKGITFYYSLNNLIKNFHVWICCMDETSFTILSRLNLENATLIQVGELEDESLLKAKQTRKLNEYCWTLKAPLCLFIFDHYHEVDHIIYTDADMFFFSDPKPIYDKWQTYSIFLCKQRGTKELEQVHGTYQAGLIGFKREKNSLEILKWWKDKCLERCFDSYNADYDSWGDQKYLDRIPDIFSNIKIIDHKGIDAAPWNTVLNNKYKISKKDQSVYIDDRKLICYHFGSMRMFNKYEYDLWKWEAAPFSTSVINYIYKPYTSCLRDTCKMLGNVTTRSLSYFYDSHSKVKSAKNYLKI